ncbi:MAG TPA: hypothetical protein VK518_18250 [Puia sp.]|nr:hypothetical protein [Puia sp.]
MASTGLVKDFPSTLRSSPFSKPSSIWRVPVAVTGVGHASSGRYSF